MKFPDAAKAGTRCPWCKNLKQGTCTGCGQTYGKPPGDVAIKVTPRMRRVFAKASAVMHAKVEEAVAAALRRPAVVLTLPAPPSANRWWRIAGSRMHLSHEAKDYKAQAFAIAGVNGQPLFPTENLAVVVVWHRDRAAGDLDKRLGVLLDALQSIKKRVPAPTSKDPKKTRSITLAPGVYDNDSQVVQIWARRCDEHPEIPKGSVRVEVSALP